MKYLNYIIFSFLALGVLSCTDDSLDPLLFNEVPQSPMLGLRDYSFDRLGSSSFVSGVDTFNILQDNSSKDFSFVCDFVSLDPALMDKVEVFVVTKAGGRELVSTVPASEFKAGAEGTNFNRAEVKVPFTTIFNASGYEICDFSPSSAGLSNIDFIEIQNDIVLTDGTRVKSSAAVNSNLFESEIFYPAHSLRFVAVGPTVENQVITIDDGDTLNIVFDSLIVRGVPDIEYSWKASNNANVIGLTAESTEPAILDTLSLAGDRREIVEYTVASTLPNGCAGTPFSVTVVIRPLE